MSFSEILFVLAIVWTCVLLAKKLLTKLGVVIELILVATFGALLFAVPNGKVFLPLLIITHIVLENYLPVFKKVDTKEKEGPTFTIGW